MAVVYETVSDYFLAYRSLGFGGEDAATTLGQTLTIDSDGSPAPTSTFA